MPTIHHGDCIETMNAMPPESVDAIVTDPPYGLGFMGKKWDGLPPSLEWAEACYRVLKPGGHIAAFGGTRTWHRLAVAIEDAGFEMRDSLAWLYGSGFPKSHDVSKAIDKAAGAEREVIGANEVLRKYMPNGTTGSFQLGGCQSVQELEKLADAGGVTPAGESAVAVLARRNGHEARFTLTAPATPEAAQWQGWGTALKPAFEPIVLARKPLAEKTVARNVLAHGTGAINVDACRIDGEANRPMPRASQGGILRLHGCHSEAELRALAEAGKKTPDGRDARATLVRAIAYRERYESSGEKVTNTGRWPANVLLDHHAAAWVDEQSGDIKGRVGMKQNGVGSFSLDGFSTLAELEASAAIGGTCPNGRDARTTLARYRTNKAQADETAGTEDQGGASRFFYTAKAPKRERPNVNGVQHPTVKPLAVMQWLLRLVTPPGGAVLDPFAGSGTTIEAALIEGFNPVGIEMEADYLPLIQHRIDRQAGTLTA